MDKPLVSVITITRNRGKLIGRCIASVLGQTYKNIEYIIVDGASDDNTDEVVTSFQDSRLKYIKLESNWPIKETLDHGISLCNGRYITFLDSDDEYLPEKIEKQVALIESLSEEYGLIYCWMTYYDNETHKVLKVHKPELKGDVRDEVIGEPIISGTPTLMFRSELLKKIDGWKSAEEIGIVSDWEMCARSCQLTKVDYVPESMVNVYVNHGSVRQSDNKNYYDESYKRQIRFHEHFLDCFSENFKRCPNLAYGHYYAIAINEFRLHHYWRFVKALFRSFYSNPKSFFKRIKKK